MTDRRGAGRPLAGRVDTDPSDLFPYGVDAAAQPGTRGVAVERHQPADLAEILERVLNTGIVIAGEIRIDLLDIELLTIKIRLVITSLDRAEEVGLDWWRNDPWYSAQAPSDSHFTEIESGTSGSDSGGSTETNGEDRDGRQTDRRSWSSNSGEQMADGAGSNRANPSVYAEEVVSTSASVAQPQSSRSRRSQEEEVDEPPGGAGASRPKAAAKKSAGQKKTAAKKTAGQKKTSAKKSAGQKKTAVEKSAGQKEAAAKKSASKRAGGRKKAAVKRPARKKQSAGGASGAD